MIFFSALSSCLVKFSELIDGFTEHFDINDKIYNIYFLGIFYIKKFKG
jgi:hypothetical protein